MPIFFKFHGIAWLFEGTVFYTFRGIPLFKRIYFITNQESGLMPTAIHSAKSVIPTTAVISLITQVVPICRADDLQHLQRYRYQKKLLRDDWSYVRTLAYRKRLKGVA